MMKLDPIEWDRGAAIANKAAELGVATKELEAFFENGRPKIPKMVKDLKKRLEAENER